MKFVKYDGMKLICDESSRPRDGAWNWWVDKFGNIEKCRLKFDIRDHFYPPSQTIKEENVIGWAETETEVLEFRKAAIEQQIPKKPKDIVYRDNPFIPFFGKCISCGEWADSSDKYCKKCGQRLDWWSI